MLSFALRPDDQGGVDDGVDHGGDGGDGRGWGVGGLRLPSERVPGWLLGESRVSSISPLC